ncbi:phenazine biosynthesis protein PhzF [Bacterioplanes sanyensis]|uniref:PhzF family phenazine biosynthesis protein n=1 Tax=Bacterioplanes sanyensis TaxID=1249553 RepID=UPI0016719081|nr:PhzF family phenazine biosynthesis protein [Bacterioplanes sanyensis]GGY43364.1 phenazine biosynthesis protein PhzF [Bacterioplanes sanyensis]
MQLEINIIDAFTEHVFEGNQAAVIITDDWLTEDLMQAIASENNLSETAFLVAEGDDHYHIRWFSPLTEIAFCGHATLAAAFVLFSKRPSTHTPSKDVLYFSAKAVGTLSVVQNGQQSFTMDFPNTCPQKATEIPAEIQQGLSIQPAELYQNQQAYFVIYNSEADVRAVQRNNDLLKRLYPRDVVVTSHAESADYDFVSRYFWPANGGDEDPVTGSIHTGLAPFWAARLGKDRLIAYQASARGGLLDCRVEGSRVYITGKAAQYLTGTITV